jgi:DNA-directed RNA polymerase specialized sigma24 family protein
MTKMALPAQYCSPGQAARNAECLLGHLEKVQGVLRNSGFSEHAIDHAVTAVYRAAMPYIRGTRICRIENRRAWVFKVAKRAATRAAMRELRCRRVAPAVLAAILKDTGAHDAPFDICDVLSQLTERQRDAVELCILGGKSHREAASHMGIRVGTLFRHLVLAKKRLMDILAPHAPKSFSAGARASYTAEAEQPCAAAS